MASLNETIASGDQATSIERLLAQRTDARAGLSGARLLSSGLDAFTLRVASARAAKLSIDAQYYIWRNDATGLFVAQELLRAADRGVHVRLLLDDMDARPRDDFLLALDGHEAIEVRLFNPFRTRRGWLRTVRELFSRGSRLNHRMHNKSWIVDRRLAVVGGRNIGDEYFAASDEINFIDTDVALAGPAVDATRDIFEEYWNCEAARPITSLKRTWRNRLTLEAVRRMFDASNVELSASAFGRRAQQADFTTFLQGDDQFDWSDVEIVADDPRKALRPRKHRAGVLEKMIEMVGATRSELLMISPYFVPGAGGVGALRDLTRRGVRVAILTNSLAATDVAAVHSGYSRYREALLAGGVQLYELKSAISMRDAVRRMHVGSSRASLHTKAVIVDGTNLFVGSFNLDPRSAELNCEMGAWIRSEPLARQLRASFDLATTPANSYTVSVDPEGRTRWCEVVDGQRLLHAKDPHAGWGRRALTRVLGWLPIESQL